MYAVTDLTAVVTRAGETAGPNPRAGSAYDAADAAAAWDRRRQDLQDLAGIIDVLTDVERRADELNRRAAELGGGLALAHSPVRWVGPRRGHQRGRWFPVRRGPCSRVGVGQVRRSPHLSDPVPFSAGLVFGAGAAVPAVALGPARCCRSVG